MKLKQIQYKTGQKRPVFPFNPLVRAEDPNGKDVQKIAMYRYIKRKTRQMTGNSGLLSSEMIRTFTFSINC